MLQKLAYLVELAGKLDRAGRFAEADELTQKLTERACPCGLSTVSDEGIAADYCDGCDKKLSDVKAASEGGRRVVDWEEEYDMLHFDSSEDFYQAVAKYESDPRLVDIGYSDRVIVLEKSDRTAQASKEKPLNKPFRTPKGPKKFSVYVKDDGKTKKVNFGDPNMSIKRDNPERRKNFRARHNCEDPGPKTKARYWSCKMWSDKKVSDIA